MTNLAINDNNRLNDVKDLIFNLDCKKNKQKFTKNLPDTIIIHYTAGGNGEASAKYLCNDKIKASAHLVVARNGKIYQLVPFNIVAWHAGVSSFNGRKGFNKYSIGIEIDNAGILEKRGNKFFSWFGKEYPSTQVIKAKHRNETTEKYWHTYTQEQIETVEQICLLLIEKYNIKTILGHEEISPGRKQDPGPAFPLDKLRDKLLNGRDVNISQDFKTSLQGKVTASALNIRENPDVKAEKIAKPLKHGTFVKILEQNGNWYKIQTEIEGWVNSKYIETKK